MEYLGDTPLFLKIFKMYISYFIFVEKKTLAYLLRQQTRSSFSLVSFSRAHEGGELVRFTEVRVRT